MEAQLRNTTYWTAACVSPDEKYARGEGSRSCTLENNEGANDGRRQEEQMHSEMQIELANNTKKGPEESIIRPYVENVS